MPSPLSTIERIGLTTVHESDKPVVEFFASRFPYYVSTGADVFYKSIVFVHGFNGHPERTRTHKRSNDDPRSRSGDLETVERPSKLRKVNPFRQATKQDGNSDRNKEVYWPRDLLPETVDGARVLTFGYNASVRHRSEGSGDHNTVYGFAWELLCCLGDAREQEGATHRPLLFVAHSLGGIIAKEALRQAKAKCASPPNAHLGSIFSSTIGIVFFGTPHRGADPRGPLHHVAEKAIRAAGWTADKKVVETLLPNSECLKELCDEFPLLASEMKWNIVSFRETRGMSILGGDKVVDDASACLGDSTLETVRDIESDHRDMCRFSGLDDPRYRKVVAAIRRIVQPASVENAVHRELLNPGRELTGRDSDSTLNTPTRCVQPAYTDNGARQEQAKPGPGLKNSETAMNTPTLPTQQQKELIEGLRFKQMDARLLTLKTAEAKTCRWLLKNEHYRDWTDAEKLTDHHGFFWIKGKPGTGKSTMMKFLFLEAKKAMRGSLVLSFFFNARGEDLEKSTSGLYRALLLQLIEKAPETRTILDYYGPSGFSAIKENGWQNETLREAFAMALAKLGGRRVVCFIDALDECPEDDVRDMVSFFEELGDLEKEAEFRVCFSSRHYPEIGIRTGLQLSLELEQEHTADVSLYVDTHLKLGNDPCAEDIKAEILRKSSNIFLWVVLVIPILNKEFDRGRIKALKKKLIESLLVCTTYSSTY
ncbi:hypothetical protein B0T24DRAFT_706512 [Lasiosphaeria ovina]|uniref:Nephrocystin 3-like N-terminal domain-containing protein n=1 Tax=Lasiosphaeria ovina TaxID=92902 RepID=A0AAE0N6Q8_9PEZI|nr:hypothetical protein B0T24DRAFT_706512 [Lasiosphaeria ovina]